MVRTDRFARDLIKALKELLPTVTWSASWCPSPGNEHVDVVGVRKKNGPILVEVELRRKNPVSNIAKIWRWFEKGEFEPYRPVVFQVFSTYYKNHESHRANAKFIAGHMKRKVRIAYYSIDLPFSPQKYGKVGGGAQRRHAQVLAKTISRQLKAR